MTAAGGAVERRWRDVRFRWEMLDVVVGIALIAGALYAVTTLSHDATVPITVAAAVLCASSVSWRRVCPQLAFAGAISAVAVYQVSGHDNQGSFVSIAVVLVAYTAGRSVAGHRWLPLLAAYALIAIAIVGADDKSSIAEVTLTWIPLVLVPMLLGRFVARHAVLVDRLHATQARLVGEQNLVQAGLVAQERCRVARDLHDVVAHCVSVMVIQTGAARLLARTDAAAARGALHTVVDCGREALTDLRRAVGVRRRDDDVPAKPRLDELIATFRASALDVRLQDPDRAPASAEIELTVFRIVQEALTNVTKHAPAASVTVSVRRRRDAIDIHVEDTGPSVAAPRVPGAGHGLHGMRERTALHGGRVDAAPTIAGGFLVFVHLPLTGAPTARTAARADLDEAPHRRLRLSGPQSDALLALAWLIPLEIEAGTSSHRSGPLVLTALCVAVMALASVIRRRAPLAFLAVAGALTIALSGGVAAPQRPSVVALYTLMFGAYTAAAHSERIRAGIGLATLVAGVAIVVTVHGAAATVGFGGAGTACLAWIVGREVRHQRELAAQVRDATERLVAEAEIRATAAGYDERVRIARDMHTLVARLVTAMTVQAEAAAALVLADCAGAVESMTVIEHDGRQALTHMRQLLGVLRADAPLTAPPARPAQDTAVPDALTLSP